MTTDEVRSVKYRQLIVDPFPDESHQIQFQEFLWTWSTQWAWKRVKKLGFPSIWAAYRKGYEKAYEEMLAAADLLPADRTRTLQSTTDGKE